MYSGVTLTMVLRYINRMLGTAVQEIELTEEEIIRVVLQESLMTYSKYFPYQYKERITQADCVGEGYTNVFRLPNKDRLEIIGVHKVWLDHQNQFGGSLLPLINDPFSSQLLNDNLSMTMTPVTFEYQAPNLITIRPNIRYLKSALVEVKAVHPRHLKTIPVSMRDQFLRLALDDVLLSLYPIRHRFESLSTVYGNISLFLEMVDGAAADKEALIDSWKENLLRDSRAKRIWIA